MPFRTSPLGFMLSLMPLRIPCSRMETLCLVPPTSGSMQAMLLTSRGSN
uniref:Uncharacterized protein n=1 Tax=Arcella intermedia TaxID=1963864 RepID=A0A6B2LX70_9EUKA